MAHPYLVLLRERPVRTLLFGLVASSLGSELYRVGAIWLAAELAGPRASLLVAAQSAAILASSLLAGAFTELVPRRALLIGTDVAAAALSFGVVVAALTFGLSFPLLVGVTVALALMGAAATPVLMASLPRLVEPGRVREVTGLFDASDRGARVAGPFLAAALMGVIPAIHLLTANAASFLASAAAVAVMGRRLESPPEGGKGPGAFLRRLSRGVTAANGCPGAWAILAATAVRGGGYALGFLVGVPLLFAQAPGEGGLPAVALVFGAAAAGELAGSVVVATMHPRRPLRRIFEGYAAIGLGLALVGAATALPPGVRTAAMAAAALLVGLGGGVAGVQMMSWFGGRLPTDDYAAILRLRLSLVIGATLATTAAGPWVLPALGPAGALLACGAATVAAALAGAWATRRTG